MQDHITFDKINEEWARKLRALYHLIKQRCGNPKCNRFKYYGARGIKFDLESWPDSRSFVVWAANAGYQPGLTIDRIDNDGNYTPSNCQFLTLRDNLRKRVMTPAWRAALDSARAKGAHVITEARREASRGNMAKARAAALAGRPSGVGAKARWYAGLSEERNAAMRERNRARMRELRQNREVLKGPDGELSPN